MRLPKTLELHRELALADLVLREDFEMTSESNLLHRPNEPFRWVVLVPLDGIPVVHRELRHWIKRIVLLRNRTYYAPGGGNCGIPHQR